jgi:GMP synthase-like glutamine amidotransferase
MLEVELTPQGVCDPIFSGMARRQKCLQWHSVHVAEPPKEAIVLASSDICRVQAMRIGNHAWSMQYHVEIEPDTVTNWGAVPAYKNALEATLGHGALSRLEVAAAAHMKDCNSNAQSLYQNFIASIS